MNKNQSNDAQQNNLDLSIDSVEPITPKKTIQVEESILDKAKGFFNKKETQTPPQFHMRKEPTFGNDVDNQIESEVEPVLNTSLHSENMQQDSSVQVNDMPVEPVVSPASETPKNTLRSPEKWKVLQILPEKHRRLFIALLALVLLLIIFFMLKPNSNTVDNFAQQSENEIPVQFQSLEQNQPVETTVLDQQNVINQNAPFEVVQPSVENTVVDSANANMPQQTQENVAPANHEVVNTQPAQSTHSVETSNVVAPAPQPMVNVRQKEDVSTHVAKPVQVQPVAKKVEPVSHEHKVQVKPQPVKKESVTKAQTAPQKTAQVAKPAVTNENKVVNPATNHKTLTISQGVSLMQVFRDNKLNISDVNAMTKASGAGNALSNFKAGDKVQVAVNGQGRVTELRLSNGARFVRQSDGSYQYKK